ncbi:trigger factor [Heliobacillus mobilis]|uniref:Trigger factor n=1 Tax=Heliobacterium mobile TaxID=28064 RepID=A0A6I3SIF4_HELMO|nr:trigger factor [Heliobacterium mobile]MTV48671.1 trigger factor [Heliobacterium mobile]
MKATVEKIDKNQVALHIEVEAEKLEKAINKAYKKLVGKINIPGFRKGKAPRMIIEARFGKEVFYEDALEFVVPEAYAQAIAENNIDPVDQPEIDVEKIEQGQPLVFKATVTVKPEVQLGEYKGVEVENKPVTVTDEDVQRQLETMQKRHARLITVGEEGEAQVGDTVTIDFEGFKDDEPFEGGKGEDYPLELGSNTFIPGFEEALIGAKVGENRDLNITFPAEYHVKTLAGQPAVFKTVVKEIKRKEYAAIDDEFAKDVSDFDSLDELKADIRKNLEESAEKTREQAKQNDVLEKVVANAELDVPQVMVDKRVEQLLEDYGQRLQYQGLSLDQFVEMTGQSKEDLKTQFVPEGLKSVKQELVLEAVAKAEALTVTEEEVDEEIETMANNYKQPAATIKKMLLSRGQIDNLKQSILLDKTVKFLVENANFVEA